jgi:hypothetical protein
MKSPPLTNQSKLNLQLIETRGLRHSVEQLKKFIFFFFSPEVLQAISGGAAVTIRKMSSPQESSMCSLVFRNEIADYSSKKLQTCF